MVPADEQGRMIRSLGPSNMSPCAIWTVDISKSASRNQTQIDEKRGHGEAVTPSRSASFVHRRAVEGKAARWWGALQITYSRFLTGAVHRFGMTSLAG
jgi:hypothetical protein